MSQNHPTDNIYNILDTLKALEPTPAETVKAQAQQIRESVESQGSILKGLREVSDVEQRLSKMFTETKKVSESQGVAEMDKSQKGAAGWNIDDYDYNKGKWTRAKIMTAKDAVKSATKDLNAAFNQADKKKKQQGVAEGLNEDLQADDGEYYKNADDFFSQFEADHFDSEETSPDRMEVRGYIGGKCVMAWRYKSAKKIGGYGIYDDSALEQDVAECAMCEAGTCMEHGAFEEIKLDELSYANLNQYKNRAVASANQHDAEGNTNKANQRYDRVAQATGKIKDKVTAGMKANGMNECAMCEAGTCTEHDLEEHEILTTKHGKIYKDGSYGNSYDDVKPKHVPRKDKTGARTKAERQAAGDAPPNFSTGHFLGPNPFSPNKVVEPPDVWKGSVTKISGASNDDKTNADNTGLTPKQRAEQLRANFKKTGKIGETNLSLSESLAQVERKVILEANLKELTKQHHMTMDEMLECLRNDAQAYKTHGRMSSLLRDCMDMHTHNKSYMPALADEGTEKPNYEVPAVQRKAAGKPPLSLGGVRAQDAERSMMPPKLDAPAPAQGVNPEAVRDELELIKPFNEELQKLAELAGLTMEHNDGNLANNYPPYDKVTQGDVVAGRLRHDQEGGDNIDEEELEEGPWEFKNAADNTKPGEHIEIDGNDTGRIKHESASVNELRRLAGMPVDETGDDTLDEDDVEVDIGVDNDKPANTAHNDEYYSMRASTMGPGEGDPGEKRQFFNQPMTGDNRMSERVDQQLESRLTAEYESIKRQKQ